MDNLHPWNSCYSKIRAHAITDFVHPCYFITSWPWEQCYTCIHGIVAIRRFRAHSITDFVHPCYFITSWEQCYTTPLHAPNTNNMEPTQCLPPLVKRVCGRPKGSRNKSQREVEDMLQRVRNCRNCGVPGHTAAQCGGDAPGRVIDAGGVLIDPQTGFLEI